jgi:hypothetical protein
VRSGVVGCFRLVVVEELVADPAHGVIRGEASVECKLAEPVNEGEHVGHAVALLRWWDAVGRLVDQRLVTKVVTHWG